MNLIDVLILGFVLLGALHGYQRGLITSIVNFLSSIVGFVVASWEYMVALHWAEQYFSLQSWLEPVIYRAILPSVQSKASSLQQQALGNILGALPPEWSNIFASLNLDGVQMPQAIEQVTHRLAGTLAERILSLIAFVCVFFVVVMVIQLLVAILLRSFGSWGGAFNRGGGLLFGGLSALIGLAVLAGVCSPLLKLGAGGSIPDLIQNSSFYPYLVGIFQALDQAFSAQLSQKLLEPLSLGKGVWF
ncbi:MAG: CvpA family protein [Desulfosporosinus sp.]|nr:CvpA family protein [Desulfosporosinus sp.]